MDFPDIETPDFPMKEKTIRNTIRSKFDGGYTLRRARNTRRIKEVTLNWKLLPAVDYVTLDAFFDGSCAGGALSFDWTHPLTGTVYDMYFVNDELEFTLDTPGGDDGLGFYNGSIILREV